MIGALLCIAVQGASGASVLADLEAQDKSLVLAEAALRESEQASDSLEEEVAQLEVDLAATRLRRAEAWVRYKTRVRALARMPTGSRRALFDSTRMFDDFLKTRRLLRAVTHHDRHLQERYTEEATNLRQQEGRLQPRRVALEEAQDGARTKRDKVASQREGRLELLRTITSERQLIDIAVREKSMARKALAGMVARLKPRAVQNGSFRGSRGKLPWPAVGAVKVRFGDKIETQHDSVTTHRGIDLNAAAGSRVQAVGRGVVAYAGWLKGYGQVIIIDHGDRFHTLSAHLARMSVEAGDSINQGDAIGAVGDTGSMRGTVLYFEVRNNGIAEAPVPWLRQ